MQLNSAFIAAQLKLPITHCYIAYSGGVDSHVLLHLCAGITELAGKLTAVYVHHGLQPEADNWGVHCQNTAHTLGVNFKLFRVNAKAQLGESPEAAARNARYAALNALIDKDTVLLVAQHREDQLETVFLQLFRGSGLRGLSGMPKIMPFGQGLLLRPLLDVSKNQIDDYARVHQLHWVDDPSNQQIDYDRNFLRNTIMPLLKQRWPALDKTVARSALHCADAEQLINQLVQHWFLSVFNPINETLSISQLQQFDWQSQCHIIRAWFDALGLKLPAQSFVTQLLTDVVNARPDRQPLLTGQGIHIRRYRDSLYCLPQSNEHLPTELVWPIDTPTLAIDRCYQLTYFSASQGIAAEQWLAANEIRIKFRQGGEKIALPGREGRHSLKKLFQEADMPPWERESIPLVYLDNTLAAVGDKWLSAQFYCTFGIAVQLKYERLKI